MFLLNCIAFNEICFEGNLLYLCIVVYFSGLMFH